MCFKRCGEKPSMIADAQVQQLMDNHAILERYGFAEQFVAECDTTCR